MGGLATAEVDGGICFALELDALHPSERLSAEEVAADALMFVTALEGQEGVRFVLQTLAVPDVDRPEQGSIAIAILVIVDADGGDVEEVCDDLVDVLNAPPLRWTFERVSDLARLTELLHPFDATSFAEIARREEVSFPVSELRAGFRSSQTEADERRSLWSMWTLGPAAEDLRRVASVMLAQEAPVCTRVILKPTELTPAEREALDGVVGPTGGPVTLDGLARASLATIEALLSLRPLYEVRYVVASPQRLSRSLLSALGDASSEPLPHQPPDRVLAGGFAVLRDDSRGPDGGSGLADAFALRSDAGDAPTCAPPALSRIRRLMGAREAATVFRIPMTDADRFPGIDTIDIPDLIPPVADLPLEGQRIGKLVGYGQLAVRLEPESRFRHTYVVGQTGTGKTTLLQNLALQDIEAGHGVAVLDPHGDLVEDLLGRIPDDRVDDVVLIDPADPVAVVGVNLLEAESAVQAAYLIEELSHMFQLLFDPLQQGIVGPRYQSMLRQAARLLMSNPQTPSSMLDMATVYADLAVRNYLVARSNDPMAMEYWATQSQAARSNDYGEVLAWFTSKFDTFRASDLVRNVLGQAESTIRFTDVLQERRILLVNLSKGLLGTYNSGLVGYVVFMKLWAASLERASIPRSERVPFHIYIDEFQNMTSESLPTVLSEARKFNVSLTLANQFFTQVPERTREAIMGNIGSKVTLRIGPRDAALFEEWLGGDVRAEDLVKLPNYVAIVAMSRRGVPIPAFAARTEAPPQAGSDARADQVRARSREQWARPVDQLDEEFASRWAHVPGSFAEQAAAARRKRASESGA